MYTMQPIPTVPVDHAGFWIVAVFMGVLWLTMLYNAKEEHWNVFTCTLMLSLPVSFAYCVSYVWTEQNPKTFANTQVQGEFVRFVAEGHSENRTSGKTTNRVDVHNTYVEYKINGQVALFSAATGVTYPQTAVFYKN